MAEGIIIPWDQLEIQLPQKLSINLFALFIAQAFVRIRDFMGDKVGWGLLEMLLLVGRRVGTVRVGTAFEAHVRAGGWMLEGVGEAEKGKKRVMRRAVHG